MRTYLMVISLLFGSLVKAQEIKTILSEKSVQVGDPITLTYELKLSDKQVVQADAFAQQLLAFRSNIKTDCPDTIKIIELEEQKDSVLKLQGNFYWQRKVKLMVMDTGYLVLPPRTFELNGETASTQPALLRVDLVPEQKDLDLYDIQEHFTELPPKPFNWAEWMSNYGWIILVCGLVLLVIGGIIWYIKTKPEPPAPIVSPEEQAIAALDDLVQQQLWKKEQPKAHFVELTQVLKRYLSQVQGENYLEKTSTEIVLRLNQEGTSEQDGRRWSFLLNVSDMVKFARSEVNQSTIESLNQQAKTLILNHRSE